MASLEEGGGGCTLAVLLRYCTCWGQGCLPARSCKHRRLGSGSDYGLTLRPTVAGVPLLLLPPKGQSGVGNLGWQRKNKVFITFRASRSWHSWYQGLPSNVNLFKTRWASAKEASSQKKPNGGCSRATQTPVWFFFSFFAEETDSVSKQISKSWHVIIFFDLPPGVVSCNPRDHTERACEENVPPSNKSKLLTKLKTSKGLKCFN